MDKELEKKVFDYYLNYYQNVCCLKNPAKRAYFRLKEEKNESERLTRLEKTLNTSFKNQNHFIVGAGTGGLAVVLKEKYNCRVFGIEPDKTALAITKAKCLIASLPPENFNLEFCENITLPDNSFDFLHCFTVLEHVRNINKSLDEMIRITKPGGKIYINTPNYSYPYEGHYKIPFPTFLPKIIGYLYLLLLGKSPHFLKTINFITARQLNRLLFKKENITWQRFYEPLVPSRGHAAWLLNFSKFTLGVYPTQEIIITKK